MSNRSYFFGRFDKNILNKLIFNLSDILPLKFSLKKHNFDMPRQYL